MKHTFEQGVLKYLASLSVALSMGLADPAPGLLQLPAPLLERVAEEAGEAEWSQRDRERILQLLALDRRPEVRARVAELVDTLWPTAPNAAQALLRRLACDGQPRVRVAAAVGMERLLRRASPVDQVALVGTWATSEVPGERAAVAAALSGETPPVFLTDLAIEELATDSSSEVRRLAGAAAGRHFEESPDTYERVLLGLATDSVRRVRRNARRELQRAHAVWS